MTHLFQMNEYCPSSANAGAMLASCRTPSAGSEVPTTGYLQSYILFSIGEGLSDGSITGGATVKVFQYVRSTVRVSVWAGNARD